MRIMSGLVIVGAIAGTGAWAQETPSPALLVLHKGENAMAIVDPESGKIAGHVPTGQDPTSWLYRPMGNSRSQAITAVPAHKGATPSPSSTSRPAKSCTVSI